MMIATYENHSIVHSTNFYISGRGDLHIFVNVNDRQRPEWIEHASGEFVIVFESDDEDKRMDHEYELVTFTAETPQEASLLADCPFTRHCKNQLHFLFVGE